jgi:GTP pyrophosphokinase
MGAGDLLAHLARRRNLAPGDPAVGQITRRRGATIHRRDCPSGLYSAEIERWICCV